MYYSQPVKRARRSEHLVGFWSGLPLVRAQGSKYYIYIYIYAVGLGLGLIGLNTPPQTQGGNGGSEALSLIK
jgi:hypothetical protein